MPHADRTKLIEKLEEARGGRTCVVFMNFDRPSNPPVPGLNTQLDASVKEALFRVLKESDTSKGLDLFVYTRGGSTNAVWPIVSLIREFDPNFEVLIPFRCHSSGTLIALGAKRIHMSRLAELSPIDPSTGNQFNPADERDPRKRLGISVEDVNAYRDFISEQLGVSSGNSDEWVAASLPLLQRLADSIHPLALGNVHRVHQQIKKLADSLLSLHEDGKHEKTIRALTSEFYAHEHMINRHEAKEILGSRIEFADAQLDELLDNLYGHYKKDFELWQPYFAAEKLGNDQERKCRFVGAVVESTKWSYLYETNVVLRQFSAFPEGVKLNIAPGQPLPLIPGLPRQILPEVLSQRWVRNPQPKGVDK